MAVVVGFRRHGCQRRRAGLFSRSNPIPEIPMKTILKLISNWQGFAALLAAAAIFYFSPTMLRWMDPTAGVFDTGYLQRPIVAASYFFFATFCAFVALQINFPTLDNWLDRNGFGDEWRIAGGQFKLVFILATLAILIAAFIACVCLVPVESAAPAASRVYGSPE